MTTLTFDDFPDLARNTFRDPEEAAARLATAEAPPVAEWLGVAIVSLVGAGLVALTGIVAPADPKMPIEAMAPLAIATLLAMSLILSAGAIHIVARLCGGQAPFRQSLRLTVWLQAVACLLQAGQVVLAAVSTGLAAFASVGILGYSIFLLIAFIKVVHGFRSRAQVFLGFLGTILLLSVLAAILIPNLVAASPHP